MDRQKLDGGQVDRDVTAARRIIECGTRWIYQCRTPSPLLGRRRTAARKAVLCQACGKDMWSHHRSASVRAACPNYGGADVGKESLDTATPSV